MWYLIRLTLFCGILVSFSIAYAEEKIVVATASNFLAPLKKLKIKFQSETKYSLIISSGSTAKLYAQIMHGAPFDVFLSADQKSVSKLINNKKAIAGSEFVYAAGKLVLWGGEKNKSAEQLHIDLVTLNMTRFAVANSKLAPYGRASMEVLKNLNLEGGIKPYLIYGENIGQTFQFIYSENVDLGFVAMSQINSLKKAGVYWEVPTNLYQPIKQSAVMLNRAKNNKAAMAFLAFLQRPDIQQYIADEFGYQIFAAKQMLKRKNQ